VVPAGVAGGGDGSERPASREVVDKVREFASRLDIKPRGDGQLKWPVAGGQWSVGRWNKGDIRVRPVLAASGGDLWCLSTPNGKRGFFWDAWSKGGEAWTRVPAPATERARISKEFLEEERRTHPDNWFRQYMCEFVQDFDGLFDMELVDKAFENYWPPINAD
jgi:hypothetical protein